MRIELKHFPMCPSVNQLYFNLPGRGRIKTPLYTHFEQEVVYWTYKNNPQLQTARILMAQDPKDTLFSIDYIFYFQPEKIITKKGNSKKLDTSNRIKAVEDVLSKLLFVDDSRFWDGSFKKRISPSPALGNFIDICITSFRL